ncbi:ROK family protein [Fictibacillus sp. WQ 8-8]|uniref:ROK family protein n=1 Tax=Fictibacillus sp. WQ 8-8 TaxID=2938788 RepID=UPI002109BB1D|nr:ROK family protein [Fictibacillus sp. WQ 8-8]MCQ6267939.1 ROK family protein [Fictibacillus sp. WQ 8-8]
MYSIGVDIGGTKIAACLVDEQGSCQEVKTIQSKPHHPEEMFDQVVNCIKRVVSDAGVSWKDIHGIGAGVPGKVDVEKGMAVYQNNLSWSSFPIAERLRNTFQTEVWIDNDVVMAAYGEWLHANSKSNEIFVYITWSTGIACCTLYNGSVLNGCGFAGELGLSFVTSSNQRIEELASGPAISRRGRVQTGQHFSTKEWVKNYYKGDSCSIVLMDDVIKTFSKGIYTIINLFDPHKIIIGGSVITQNPFLLRSIKDSLKDLVLPEQQGTVDRLFISHLDGKAALIGAALKRNPDFRSQKK